MNDLKNQEFQNEGLEALSKSIKIGFFWIYAIALLMGLVIISQSFVIVKEHQKAFIFRFGEFKKVVGTGLHIILPYPIEKAEIYEVSRARQIQSSSFMFSTGKEGTIESNVLKTGIDGYIISKDLNILHAKSILTYYVNGDNTESLITFFINTNDPENTIRQLLDNSILKAAAQLTTDEILVNTEKFRSKTASELRTSLDTSGFNLIFENKDITITTYPPIQTKASFDALTNANQNQDTILNEALSYKIKTEKDAQGNADSIIAIANAEKIRKIATAQAEAENFSNRILQYQKNPDLVSKTIYDETMFRIMKNVDEKFIIEDSDNRQIRLLLGRSLDKKKEQNKK
mgnify:CR=1 FL=1